MGKFNLLILKVVLLEAVGIIIMLLSTNALRIYNVKIHQLVKKSVKKQNSPIKKFFIGILISYLHIGDYYPNIDEMHKNEKFRFNPVLFIIGFSFFIAAIITVVKAFNILVL